jgi:hypothetical protein
MEHKDIQALLEKYWEGTSTLEEEDRLKDFFTQEQVVAELPENLKVVAALFAYTDEVDADLQVPELFAAGQAPWEQKQTTRVVSLGFQRFMRYAAVVLMVVGLGYSAQVFVDRSRDMNQVAFADTYSDPQEAYEETQRALQLLSKNLNKGVNSMEKLGVFHDASQMISNNND